MARETSNLRGRVRDPSSAQIINLEIMGMTKVSEAEEKFEREVTEQVNHVFKRAYKIRKIRRRKKLNNWLSSCKN